MGHLAMTSFEGALARDPTRELYYIRLGRTAQHAAQHGAGPDERRARFHRALRAFERAVTLVPANAYNHANLGRLLGDMARAATDAAQARDLAQRAFAAFDRALALDRNNAYFYRDAATAALELGDLERARLYAHAGADKYPHFGPVRAQLGHIALLEGRADEAVPRSMWRSRVHGTMTCVHGCTRSSISLRHTIGSATTPQRSGLPARQWRWIRPTPRHTLSSDRHLPARVAVKRRSRSSGASSGQTRTTKMRATPSVRSAWHPRRRGRGRWRLFSSRETAPKIASSSSAPTGLRAFGAPRLEDVGHALVEIELCGPASGLDGLGLAEEVVPKNGLRAALDQGGRKAPGGVAVPRRRTERGCWSLGSVAAEEVRPVAERSLGSAAVNVVDRGAGCCDIGPRCPEHDGRGHAEALIARLHDGARHEAASRRVTEDRHVLQAVAFREQCLDYSNDVRRAVLPRTTGATG